MARIRLPRRPNPARVQAARLAAARVGTASAQSAVSEEIDAIEVGIPSDLAATIETLNTLVEDLDERVGTLESS